MDRDGFGKLWLCWYVHRSNPSRAFERVWESVEDAQQLQVRDVADNADVWEALRQPHTTTSDQRHAVRIELYEDRYRDATTIVFIPAVWVVHEGHVIIDGAHRACAVYRLSPTRFDADLIALTPPASCPDTQAGPSDTGLT